jgi:ppGpp synthetase/RelA/SpoT-type nucleotidyltranferase
MKTGEPTGTTLLVPKPELGVEYTEWLLDRHGVGVGAEARATYEAFALELERKFRASAFWTTLPTMLDTLHANYKVEQRGARLLPASPNLALDIKKWDSFWEKTYRINVVNNPRWPDEPVRGWALPSTWFQRIGDIVRTKVIVRYLDALALVATAVTTLAGTHGLSTETGRVASEDGYYATHVDVGFPVKFSTGIDLERVMARVEIQVTTELQENIYDLAHRQYVSRRIRAEREADAWRWDYRGDEFAANYLGHVLHYLEGMIMRLWEAPDGRTGD